jgi:hypothetical protein
MWVDLDSEVSRQEWRGSGQTPMNASPHIPLAPIAKSSRPPRLREVRFTDHAQVAGLATKFDLEAEGYDAWTHFWKDNPAYRRTKGTLPMGWVLEAADGRIVGHLGNIPLDYELDGRRLLAATTRSWVVDTDFRSYSLLLLGTYFQQANVDLFLCTTVNAQAAIPFDVFEAERVPVGAWDRTLFWITHPQGFTESFLRKKGWPAAKPLSYPLSLGVSVRNQLRGSGFRRVREATPVVGCDGFDDRFETFWAAVKRKKCNLLLAARNRAALQWHFKFALQQRAAWIYAVEGTDGLAAYAVFLRQDRPQVGLRRACLADFQCLDQARASIFLMAMLQAAAERCRQESIHMLELIGPTPELEGITQVASPHCRQLASWMYFYKTNDVGLRERLKKAEAWEPSLFDGDCSL